MAQDGTIRLETAPGRRLVALGVLYTLGAVTVWLGFAAGATSGFGLSLALIAIGAAALVMGEALRRAAPVALELTEEGLRDSTGRWLARWDEIERVESGAFAFKPSNGFALLLVRRAQRGWVPGLWWRVGRRVGVGGVTPPRMTKAFADAMAIRLAERKR